MDKENIFMKNKPHPTPLLHGEPVLKRVYDRLAELEKLTMHDIKAREASNPTYANPWRTFNKTDLVKFEQESFASNFNPQDHLTEFTCPHEDCEHQFNTFLGISDNQIVGQCPSCEGYIRVKTTVENCEAKHHISKV